MANITRDQFEESKGVIKKIVQSGVRLTDADLNEQFDITLQRDRRMLSCLCAHASKRFSDGFGVVGNGSSLQVVINAGFAAYLIDSELATLLMLAEDYTLTGFTAWTAARTDYIYIDILEAEISAANDPNIVNPDVGEETCRDMRETFTFHISQGTAPGTAPAGHTYVTIATVTKSSGSNIEAGDVINLIDAYGVAAVDTDDIVDDAVTAAKIADDAVDTLQLVDGAVTTDKLDSGAVTESKITDQAVTAGKLGNSAVTVDKVATNAISTGKIVDDAVTRDKINADVAGDGLEVDGYGALTVTGIVESYDYKVIKEIVVQIGPWDMNSTSSILLSPGLPALSNIRDVRVMIMHDLEGLLVSLERYSNTSGLTDGGWYITTSGIYLLRTDSGYFDSTDFDSTSINRGYIIVRYEA